MKLRLITEWGETDEAIRQYLMRVDPAMIIDDGIFASHNPFVYIHNDNQKLYFGNPDTFHNGLLRKFPRKAKLIDAAIYAEPGLGPVAVGRVGYGFIEKENAYPPRPKIPDAGDMEFVSFYDHSSNQAGVQGCILALLREKHIDTSAYVTFAGNVRRLNNAPQMSKPTAEPTDEQKERSRLIAAVHLGTWPDGRRMSPEEKADLQKKLGMRSVPMKKNRWQSEMEKHGIIHPGQRWWTPTSEAVE